MVAPGTGLEEAKLSVPTPTLQVVQQAATIGATPYASGTRDNGTSWSLYAGDSSEVLHRLPADSVNSVVTSPPYYWQRDYDVDGQFGLEPTIDGYVDNLRDTFDGLKRVLTKDGTVFLNLGDTYYSAKGRPHGQDDKHKKRRMSGLRAVDGPGLGLPRKSMIGIPWRVALALQQDGWTLRSAIIWVRNSAIPEPTSKDRPWRKYEHIFLFSKSTKYYFNRDGLQGEEDVWYIEPDRRAVARGTHYAPYPRALVSRCIDAGCPPGGVVLDPFVGGGTTMYVADEKERSSIGIELNPTFCDLIKEQMTTETLPRDARSS
jgi:DNA modification methylase